MLLQTLMSRTYRASIRYLSTSEVLRIAEALDIDRGTYDAEALFLALRRTSEGTPSNVVARIHEFAGSLLEGLIQLSPFGLGNEDLARHAVARFYEINDWTLNPDHVEVCALVDDLGAARVSVFAAAATLRGVARRAQPR